MILIASETVECVNTFNNLGCTITSDCDDSAEIKVRTATAKAACIGLKTILKDYHISKNLKLKLLRTNDWARTKIGDHETLLLTVERRQLEYLGRFARKGSLEKICLNGNIEVEELVVMVQDWCRWRRFVRESTSARGPGITQQKKKCCTVDR